MGELVQKQNLKPKRLNEWAELEMHLLRPAIWDQLREQH